MLHALERPVTAPEGALVLMHGRGADEYQLIGLFDALDPEQRLTGLAPRAPHPYGPGCFWYGVEQPGQPERESFLASCRALSEWLDELDFEPDQITLAGFSQGATMSYALGLGAGRPRPAALIALSGYIPDVEGWEIDLSPPLPRIAIGHGTFDDVLPVELARSANSRLVEAGADVFFEEEPTGHAIDPSLVAELAGWLQRVTSSSS